MYVYIYVYIYISKPARRSKPCTVPRDGCMTSRRSVTRRLHNW